MPHEILLAEHPPHRQDRLLAEVRAQECSQGLALGLRDPFLAFQGVAHPAPERPQGAVVKLGQQGILPTVPERGVGAADVGDREQIEIIETHPIPDCAREFVDHLGVRDVAALGGHGHEQVVLDEPGHEAGIEVAEPVIITELGGVATSELGMIGAPALGDVVIEPGDIEQLGLGELGHDAPAHFGGLGGLRIGKAPQVLHHEERMDIDGVDMEQIELHEPGNGPEYRQVGAQHPVAVHARQLMADAMRLADDLHEQRARLEVLAELVVDEMTVVAD